MYAKIIVPLDGSQLSEAALDYSKSLAASSGANLTVLHVCRSGEHQYLSMHRGYTERIVEKLTNEFQRVGAKSHEIESAVSVGDPASEILRFSEEQQASLIIMSTHGHSGLGKWAMGGVSDKVVRHSSVPVLMVRAMVPRPRSKDMLVLLDGTQLSEQVLPHAKNYAETFGMGLTLLRVFDPPYILSDYPEGTAKLTWQEHVDQITSAHRRECAGYLEEIANQLRGEGLKVKVKVLLGKADEQIVEYLDQAEFDLVSLSTHGRAGIRRWALGSIAEKILHASSTPVLLVRPGSLPQD